MVRFSGKQRYRKAWLDPEPLVARSKQQKETVEDQRKAWGINDNDGIAKESVAC